MREEETNSTLQHRIQSEPWIDRTSRNALPPWPKMRQSTKPCYLHRFGWHVRTGAAHWPLTSQLPLWRNISEQKWGELRWNRLMEESKCQNVTNFAEPSVPKSPLSIPTSTLKRHSVTRGSAVLEDTADLTTTRWLSFGTRKICVFGQRHDLTASNCWNLLISRQVTLKVTVLISKFRKPSGNCPEQGGGGRRGDSWGQNGDLLRHNGPDVQRPLSGQRWLLIGLVLIMGPKALLRRSVMPGLRQAADTGFVCDSSVWYITGQDGSSGYKRRQILRLFGHSAHFQCSPLNKLWTGRHLQFVINYLPVSFFLRTPK